MKRNLLRTVIVMILSLLSSTSLWATSSGKCGENITWKINLQGELIVMGTGKMIDYSKGGINIAPWGKEIKSVTIEKGITHIGTYAFYNCESLKTVTIGESVTEIGNSAFSGCTNLNKISSYAIEPPKLGIDAFENFKPRPFHFVMNVPQESETKYITSKEWKDFFFLCGDMVAWTWEEGRLRIMGTGDMENFTDQYGSKAPWSPAVNLVVIGKGVTNIGTYAFYNCRLEEIEIGESVSKIGSSAFKGCTKLNRILTYAMEPPVCETGVFDDLNSKNCTVEIPQGTASQYIIAEGWKNFFDYCGNTISWSLDKNGALTLNGTGEMSNYSTSGANVTPWGKEIKSVTISEGITKIGDNAFNGCTQLRRINTLAITPPTLGTGVFDGIDTECCLIEMPQGTEMKYMTDKGWKNMFNFYGETVAWAFDEDYSVHIFGTGPTYDFNWKENAFSPWRKEQFHAIKEVFLSEGITGIGDYALMKLPNITSINIPNSVTYMNGMVLYFNSDIETAKIGTGMKYIGNNAFAGCSRLKHLTVLAQEPPLCEKSSFDGIKSCTLEVPAESIEKYKNADIWKDFYKIIPIDIETDINEIRSDNAKLAISVQDGYIAVNGVADNAKVSVYSISGATIYQGTAKTIAPPKAGIYIVRVGNKTTKVAVR